MGTLFKILTVAGIFSFVCPAGAQVCQQRIYFLPQTHDVQNIPNVVLPIEAYVEVAESQLKIVNYLDRFPRRPVFSEQASTASFDVSQFTPKVRAGLETMIRGVFPAGYDLDPRSLNEAQAKKLVDNGGEFIQMMRGRLSTIHRVLEDKQTGEEIFAPILEWYSAHPKRTPYPPEIARLVYGEREREALKQVVKYFAANPKEHEAVLIFGKNHNFSFYPDIFPPQCVVVPSEFQEDWDGQFRAGPEGFPPQEMRTDALIEGRNAE